MATLASLVVLSARTDRQTDALVDILDFGFSTTPLDTSLLQWFALRYTDVSPPTFAVLATFAGAEERDRHISGPLPGLRSILNTASESDLLVGDAEPDIKLASVIASRVTETRDGGKTAGLSKGLRVIITPKADKIDDVQDLLTGALPLINDRPHVHMWYAVRFTGTDDFGVFVFLRADQQSNSDPNHNHLDQLERDLLISARQLMICSPDIVRFTVHAARVTMPM